MKTKYPIIDISELITVANINKLEIERYEAAPMLSGGWTKLCTSTSIIGYMDEVERICKLSIHPKSKFLFRADGPDLYYAKLRLVREVCKKCRNKAYKDKEPGRWTDGNSCLPGSWFPNVISPIRPIYGNLSTVYCPAPIVNDWAGRYMVPKIYNILINNKSAFSEAEFDMVMRGNKHNETRCEYQKVKEASHGIHGIHSKIYKKASIAAMDADVFNRIGVKADSLHYAALDCIMLPPIWCPYKKEHEEI